MTGPDLLEKYRKTHGLTREALAKQIGVTPQILYYWQTRERSPGARSMFAIERATGIPVSVWAPKANRTQRG